VFPPTAVFFVGNVMIDTLMAARERAMQSGVIESLGLGGRPYGLLTLHRPSNVDDPAVLRALLDTLDQIARDMPLAFPVHPRTRASSRSVRDQAGPGAPDTHRAARLPGLPQAHAKAKAWCLTDSGGVQEETTVLGVPCLTLRDNTGATGDHHRWDQPPGRHTARVHLAGFALSSRTPGLRRSAALGRTRGRAPLRKFLSICL